MSITAIMPSRDGLVAEYLFSGNTQDTSGNGNHATNSGATLVADKYGRANEAYQTNMQSQYISIPDSAQSRITGDCTIIWAGKLGTAAATNKLFVNKYQDDNNIWSIQQAGANPERIRLTLRVGGVAIVDIYHLANPNYNNFQYYTWVLDSVNGNKFYINGVVTATTGTNTGAYGSGNTAALRLGAYAGISTDSNVIHDSFEKINRCLTAEEITKRYNFWLSH